MAARRPSSASALSPPLTDLTDQMLLTRFTTDANANLLQSRPQDTPVVRCQLPGHRLGQLPAFPQVSSLHDPGNPSTVAPTVTGSRSSIPRMQRDMLLQAGLGAWNIHFHKETCWGLGHGLLVPRNVTYLYRVLFQGPTGSARELGQAISGCLVTSQVCPPSVPLRCAPRGPAHAGVGLRVWCHPAFQITSLRSAPPSPHTGP